MALLFFMFMNSLIYPELILPLIHPTSLSVYLVDLKGLNSEQKN